MCVVCSVPTSSLWDSSCGAISLLYFMAKVMQIGHLRDNSAWNYFLYNEEKEKSISQVPVTEGGSIVEERPAEGIPQT